MEKKIISFNAEPDVVKFLQSIYRRGNSQTKSKVINLAIRIYMDKNKLINHQVNY